MAKICRNCGRRNYGSRYKCQFCNSALDAIDLYNNSSSTYTTNSGYQIKRHNFEKAKNEIKIFSENSYTYTEFDKFETDGGFLYLGSHKVTGAEMNSYTEKVKEYLQELNNIQIDTIEHFKNIYDAFESLDKDYIQGLIISVKSAEKAAEDAKTAGFDAQKALKETDKTVKDLAVTQQKLTATTAALEKTIVALSQFKSKLDRIEHLNEIDTMWIALEKTIATLQALTSKYDEIDQLYDVNKMQKNKKNRKKNNSNKKAGVALFLSINSFILIAAYIALNFMGIL